MAKLSITSANAVYMLSITTVYPTPQQIQGFAPDAMFETADVDIAELVRGADGTLSAGFVFANQPQTISLMANSPSCGIFDFWRTSETTVQEKFSANATILFPNLSAKWSMQGGYLTSYSPIPMAGRTLNQPRKFVITWGAIVPAAA